MAAMEERLRNKGHGGHKTLYGYFTATSDTSTSGTAASKSDDTCAADGASSLDTNADRTSSVSDSSESSDSCMEYFRNHVISRSDVRVQRVNVEHLRPWFSVWFSVAPSDQAGIRTSRFTEYLR